MFHNLNVKYIKNNLQGYSLVETAIVAALTSIVILGVINYFTFIADQNQTITRKQLLDENIYNMSFYLKHVLSMGVNVDYIPDKTFSVATFNKYKSTTTFSGGPGPNIGKIREYDSSLNFDSSIDDHSSVTIGYFLRDNLQSKDTSSPSPEGIQRFAKTGVFFQKQTAKTFGVLYLDLGDQAELKPSASDLRFDGIVSLKVTDAEYYLFNQKNPDKNIEVSSVNVEDFKRLASLSFKITVRMFLNSNHSEKHRWCPPELMNTDMICKTTEAYKDVEKVVRVVFRNNVIGLSQSQSLRDETRYPHGKNSNNLDYYNGRIMPLEKRPFDLVYFLKTNYVHQLSR